MAPNSMGNDRAAVEAPALRFGCVPAEDLDAVRQAGLAGREIRIFGSLTEAQAHCGAGERLLVLQGAGRGPEAIANLDPYRPPEPVTAGGGLVVRAGAAGPEVLLIFRRGAWDLPKGKLDPGETVEACALREVREELGIEALEIVGPAGVTVHGYPEGDRFMVKTTHWFFMRTPERDFTPEAREGITEARWVPWAEAPQRLGYATLRAHLAGLRLGEAGS